jgi:hypothetical protein
MRSRAVLGIWFSTLVAGVAVPESAPASLRWRTDGNWCLPSRSGTDFASYAAAGLKFGNGSPEVAVDCAIPTGAGLVNLGSGSHAIDQVNVRLRQEQAPATVATYVVVHDDNTTSACTCGQASAAMNAGAYATRAMLFDCGSCSYGEHWLIDLRIDQVSKAGNTLVELISVYDAD